MTTNAYLFMWTQYGIEAIVPITQYEEQDKLDTWNILRGQPTGKNPLDDILSSMQLRARFNPGRHYEIYAMDCEEGITEEQLFELWDSNPQYAADLTREKGVCMFNGRKPLHEIKVR
jgi:hypothetical protein